MLKNKRILLTILVVLLLLLVPTMVKATNEQPTVNTQFEGANNIKVTLTDITLDDSKEHKFGISKAKATQPTEWLDLQSIDESQCTAIITPQNEAMRLLLRSSNQCYIFIKNVTDNENIVITAKVNLPEKLNIFVNTNNAFEISYLYEKCKTFYENLGNYQIAAVKIDNKDIIKEYLKAKENNQNTLNAVAGMLPTQVPTSSWVKMYAGNDFTDTSATYAIRDLIKYEGLYMVWGQVSYLEGRTIVGYTLYDNYPNDYVLPEEPQQPQQPEEPEQEEPTQPEQPQEPAIDTTQYVSFPYIIMNGTGDAGDLSVKSYEYDGDYEMYYQFVEVSDAVYNKIMDLAEKYENAEITYEEYFTQYYETMTKYNNKKWKKTEDGSFKHDISEFTGTKKFALWVKLVMADKTSYEAQIYTMNGQGQAANEPQKNEGLDKTDKEDKKDNTIAPGNIPYTGGTFVMVVAALGIIAIGLYAYKRNNDLKGI